MDIPTRRTQCNRPNPSARQRIVCFPPAGGSTHLFQTWGGSLPDIEVHAVCYPGRVERIGEPFPLDLVSMAMTIATEMRPLLDRPVLLFGHGMGAIVAYETARALESKVVKLLRLFISGAGAPHMTRPGLTGDDQGSGFATLAELGGVEAELLRQPISRKLILPHVADDFRLLASYEHRPGPLLTCPVTAVVGDSDPRVPVQYSECWAELTTGEFRHKVLPGGHLYLTERHPFALANELGAALRSG